jgi:hypothetical protein
MHLLPKIGHEKALQYADEMHKEFVTYARKRSVEDYLKENPGFELPVSVKLKKEAKYRTSLKT